MNSDEIREVAHDQRERVGRMAAALCEVEGVAAADLDADGSDLIARVRLVPGADARQVAAAAEEVLRDRFGLGLAPDGIEIVDDAAPPERPAAATSPFVLDHVEIVGHGDRRVAVVAVTVVDAAGVHPFSGSAIVTANDQRAVAEAVLDAVNRGLA